QYLLELGQRANRRLLDARDRAGRGRAQTDGDGHRLGVIQQQRRELSSGAESISAGDAGRGLDRVAERAQLVDVTANRPRADLEPVGELLPGPLAPDLEQRQEGEEARRG